MNHSPVFARASAATALMLGSSSEIRLNKAVITAAVWNRPEIFKNWHFRLNYCNTKYISSFLLADTVESIPTSPWKIFKGTWVSLKRRLSFLGTRLRLVVLNAWILKKQDIRPLVRKIKPWVSVNCTLCIVNITLKVIIFTLYFSSTNSACKFISGFLTWMNIET